MIIYPSLLLSDSSSYPVFQFLKLFKGNDVTVLYSPNRPGVGRVGKVGNFLICGGVGIDGMDGKFL